VVNLEQTPGKYFFALTCSGVRRFGLKQENEQTLERLCFGCSVQIFEDAPDVTGGGRELSIVSGWGFA
jgi:hypothetical protein